MTAELIRLTRGEAIIEVDGETFNVNGEGLGDGTWQVFPLMVYEFADHERWELIQDAAKRRAVVAALQTCWPDSPGGWPDLVVLEEHYQYETPLILPYDIVARVAQDFPDPDDAAKVRSELAQLDCPEAPRVARCVLHLSAGSVPEVTKNIARAAQDYRDAILFAEYDRDDRRQHDFSKPFDN